MTSGELGAGRQCPPGVGVRILVDVESPTFSSRRELDRRIISLAIPALGTLAIEPLYVLVDTAIVGRLGTPQLGGVAIAMTILLTVISLTASLEYGVTPDVAFAHGAGRSAEARDVATAALRLAVMIGVPMGAIVALAARPACVGCSAAAATCWSTRSPICESVASACRSC